MSNLVFPTLPGLIYPVKKTPSWSTNIQEAASGKETRVNFWSFPKWSWSLTFELLRDKPLISLDELWTLAGFFNKHYGSYDSWLFNDPDDNTVTAQGFGTGDGVTTQFQLARTRGGFTEPVKDVNAAPAIYKAGVLQTLTTHYSVSATGLITFVAAPAAAAALTWTGTYYWRCRFLDDTVDFEKFASQMWESNEIKFVSVK